MQENIKTNKTLLAGVLNLVNAFLCMALTIAYFIVHYSDILGKGIDNGETIGFVVILIVFVPLAIITFVPIVIDIIYKVIFAIILLGRVRRAKIEEITSVKKGYYIASLVIKIISTIALSLEAILISAIMSSGGLPWLGLTFALVILAVIILQIVLIFIENASHKELQ